MTTLDKFISKTSHDNLCVVIGVDNSTGLSILRDLGRHGVKILAFDTKLTAIGRVSKYCNYFTRYVDYQHLLEILLSVGKKLLKKIPIQVADDQLLIFIERYKKVLREYFLFHWQSNTKLIDILDKKKMLQFAINAGLDVPVTFSDKSASIETIEKNIKYPFILKPPFTLDQKLVVVNSRKDYECVIKERKDNLFKNGFIVQELIHGPETNILFAGSYSNSRGDIIATACGRKLRQLPRNFGIATSAVSIKNDNLKKLTEKFTRYIQYAGPLDIEFKKSTLNGKYIFIEMNPRISGYNQFFTSSGCHLAYICYLDLKNKLSAEIIYRPIRDDVRYVSIFFDLLTVFRSYNKISLLNWTGDTLNKNSFAVFSLEDIGPFLANFIKLLVITLKKFRSRFAFRSR